MEGRTTKNSIHDQFLDCDLFQSEDRILVAVSGGADSLALLHALARVREELGLALVAAHVHHGMRGEEAEADIAFLQETCDRRRIPLAVEEADVPRLAEEQRISVEEAGRIARYAAFQKLTKEYQCQKVATAHTADDQAETVLLNLFRGAGIDGLAGIPARRPLFPAPDAPEVVRPLLRRWRSEIEEYCRAHSLEPRLDRTNLDLRYRRNRIRHQLLPSLAEYDPAIKEHLVRLATQAREEAKLLLPESEVLLRDATTSSTNAHRPLPWRTLNDGQRLLLDCAVLAAAPASLTRRALRLALRRTAGHTLELDAALVERLLEMVRGTRRTALDLAGCDYRVRRLGNLLVIEEAPSEASPPLEPVLLSIPGKTEAPEFGIRVEAAKTPVPQQLRVPPDEALMDADSLDPPVMLRAPQAGDRFRPLGGRGSRLLSDLFTDRKVPVSVRPAWPVLTDQKGMIWVLGLATADRVRVHPDTRRCVHLKASSLGR